MIVKTVCKKCGCAEWTEDLGECKNCGYSNCAAHRYWIPLEDNDIEVRDKLMYVKDAAFKEHKRIVEKDSVTNTHPCNVDSCEYSYEGNCNYCGDYWTLNNKDECMSYIDENEGMA